MGRAYIFAPKEDEYKILNLHYVIENTLLTMHSSSLAMLATSSLAGTTLIPWPLLLQKYLSLSLTFCWPGRVSS